ncbi:MAG: hypothetical protein M1834_001390 [Cirrosporium novae-zelandiae]|nr:MAG: hypothetical protein M1834_001390 [Cirrosporium novae-zelandiae]
MVLLTMTPAIVSALQELHDTISLPQEPSLTNPAPGRPISHTQIIILFRALKESSKGLSENAYRLNDLLHHANIYVPPPPPKPEPTPEYLALMKRLRHIQEQTHYSKITSQQHPSPFGSSTFDELTYSSASRQSTLIINILLSVFATAVALYLIASSWTPAARVLFGLAGGILVAVAETAVYLGYLQRLWEAKEEERKKLEKREVVDTWVIGGTTVETKDEGNKGLRNRKNGEKEGTKAGCVSVN